MDDPVAMIELMGWTLGLLVTINTIIYFYERRNNA